MFRLGKLLRALFRSGPPVRRSRSFRPRLDMLEDRLALSTYFVSTTGNNTNPGTLTNPFGTIQYAIDHAAAGDTVEVLGGTYNEKLTFHNGGNATAGYLTLEAYNGQHVVLNGANVPARTTQAGTLSNSYAAGDDVVDIVNQSYIKLIGFEITDPRPASTMTMDACGVYIGGSGTNVQILDNTIDNIAGKVKYTQGGLNYGYAGSAIQVYGTNLNTAYSNVVIDHNSIYNCAPGDDSTETVTLNGNVTGFQITNNLIHDCNNIGIDMIGGEAGTFGLPDGTVTHNGQQLPVARNGVCSGNILYGIHANYGGGNAGAIYVDGGKNINITNNVCYSSDLGLEVGAENHGFTASGVVVENNVLAYNTQGGLLFGGYAYSKGRVQNCTFANNTLYQNDTSGTGNGQLYIQYASNNTVTNNILVAGSDGVLISGDNAGNYYNKLDHNLDYASVGRSNAEFDWNGNTYTGWYAYRNATNEDAHSVFANPMLNVDTSSQLYRLATGQQSATGAETRDSLFADLQLNHEWAPQSGSLAIGAGSSTTGQYAATDFYGVNRNLPPTIGAVEP